MLIQLFHDLIPKASLVILFISIYHLIIHFHFNCSNSEKFFVSNDSELSCDCYFLYTHTYLFVSLFGSKNIKMEKLKKVSAEIVFASVLSCSCSVWKDRFLPKV